MWDFRFAGRAVRRGGLAVAAAVLVGLLSPDAAEAGDFRLSVLVGGGASAWRDDPTATGALWLGYRFRNVVGIYGGGRIGYAPVDQRLTELLGIGAQVWIPLEKVQPFARIGLLHQHETPLASILANPGGAIFGVGDGIRHRGGVEGGLGVDVPFFQRKEVGLLFTGEVVFAGFPNSSGPDFYVLGQAGLTLHYSL